LVLQVKAKVKDRNWIFLRKAIKIKENFLFFILFFLLAIIIQDILSFIDLNLPLLGIMNENELFEEIIENTFGIIFVS
jgi:hypothetical protein